MTWKSRSRTRLSMATCSSSACHGPRPLGPRNITQVLLSPSAWASAGWNSLPGASSLASRYSASPFLLSRRSSSSTAARSWELYDRNASKHLGPMDDIVAPSRRDGVWSRRPDPLAPAYVAASSVLPG